ncbi:MAG: AAA family ATPase [Acidobacteriota bacterium]
MDLLLAALKYQPAIKHPLALERTYLQNLFSNVFDVPLIILEANSGYGKTTMLSSVAHREGVSARWLTLDDSDAELYSFVHNLLQAIYGRTIPKEDSLHNVQHALSLILGAVKEQSVSSLILDNFDTVARSQPVSTLLEQLIDQLPPFTHLIIATKKPPNLRHTSRQRHRSVILTQSDLRFDVDDVSQYFLKVYNYKLLPEDAAFIIERTEGRPVLINLLGQLTRNLPNYLKIDWRQLPMSPEQEAVKLLLREVITKLPKALSRMAASVRETRALLSDGASPLCNLLDTLAERHCLVQQYCDNGNGRVINVPHEILVDLSSLI